jgi:protein-tyrosine phosphatase
MSSEPVTPPIGEGDHQDVPASVRPSSPLAAEMASSTHDEQPEYYPHLHFSFIRWTSSGVVRLSYRLWTRIAARLFPENSPAESIAQTLRIPLPDRLNMSWVTDYLAVGGRIRPDDIPALALRGVNHVVDTRSEYHDDEQALKAENIDLLQLPTPDTYPLSVEQLIEGATWVTERIERGEKVLIHCEHGVGRSVLLTCAVLVDNGMSAHDALALVQEKRWQASPNHRQIARLKEFESVRGRRARA